MPIMNGVELIREIKKLNKTQEVIIVSAFNDSEYLSEAIAFGVTGYIIKPIDFKQILQMLEQSVKKLVAFSENEMYKNHLQELVEQRTHEVVELQKKLTVNFEQTIESLVRMIEERDTYTGGHSERVAKYSYDIAKEYGLSENECENIYTAGILHDIGKVATPDAILLKPNKLTDLEYSLIKNHVSAGYEILSKIEMYSFIAEIIHAHHEHFDGSGYPQGLVGSQIPIEARIMSIADTFDAMTTNRIYKVRMPAKDAIEEIKSLSGQWFDPDLIEAANNALSKIKIDNLITQDPSTIIDEERFAYFYKDALTNTFNHYYLDYLLGKNIVEKQFSCLSIIYLKNFSQYNKENGWSKGDELLIKMSISLQELNNGRGKIFRVYGDDFVVLQDDYNCEINIDAINNFSFLQDNQLYCEVKHFDLTQNSISSYLDL